MTKHDDIRKALPMLDEQGVDLMVGTGVSLPLVSSIVAALRKHGHAMPTNAAKQSAAACRTITAVAGLVNAYEGRDPFDGVSATMFDQRGAAVAALGRARATLKTKLVDLSPVADADEYRAAFTELVDVEAELVAQQVEHDVPALAVEVTSEWEITLGELLNATRTDAVTGGVPVTLHIGHRPTHVTPAEEEAVVTLAWQSAGITITGCGNGFRWLVETLRRRLADLRRIDGLERRGTSLQ